MPVSVQKMEKRFVSGLDVSPEVNITSGYPSIWVDANNQRIAVMGFYNCDDEKIWYTWDIFSEEDSKDLLDDFLELNPEKHESYADYTGQSIEELIKDVKGDEISLMLAMREMWDFLGADSVWFKTEHYAHVLAHVLYGAFNDEKTSYASYWR